MEDLYQLYCRHKTLNCNDIEGRPTSGFLSSCSLHNQIWIPWLSRFNVLSFHCIRCRLLNNSSSIHIVRISDCCTKLVIDYNACVLQLVLQCITHFEQTNKLTSCLIDRHTNTQQQHKNKKTFCCYYYLFLYFMVSDFYATLPHGRHISAGWNMFPGTETSNPLPPSPASPLQSECRVSTMQVCTYFTHSSISLFKHSLLASLLN